MIVRLENVNKELLTLKYGAEESPEIYDKFAFVGRFSGYVRIFIVIKFEGIVTFPLEKVSPSILISPPNTSFPLPLMLENADTNVPQGVLNAQEPEVLPPVCT
jgi:hypothetical protein